MKLLFMDEKGPQNSFRVSSPFDKYDKILYADDKMTSYVANVIQIDEDKYYSIEEKYRNIVSEYLLLRPQLGNSLNKNQKELKGQHLLKSNFEFGIASMKQNEIQFYINLLDVLFEYNVGNLTFLINKMSIISTSRLNDFFYSLDLNNIECSPFLVKHVITKYLEIEASEEVIKSFLDKSISTKKLLKMIQSDMKSIVSLNLENNRMKEQIQVYEIIIGIIGEFFDANIKLNEPDIPLSFDWKKVRWAFDLWLTEQKLFKNGDDWKLFLDEGIPKSIFVELNFNKIYENCDSKKCIGLQITDMIVALIGKLVSKLSKVTRYKFEEPDKRVLIPSKYFELTREQFNLIKKLNLFIIGKKQKFHYINDAYFDSSVLLQSYFQYISSYDSYENYKKIAKYTHKELQMETFKHISEDKWVEAIRGEDIARICYGSIKAAVENGIYRPL